VTTAGRSPGVLKRILTQLTSVTCQGVQVSSIAGCVRDGVLCSNHGSCQSGECACDSGWSGSLCEGTSVDSVRLWPRLELTVSDDVIVQMKRAHRR
jgi:hypothetical protein